MARYNDKPIRREQLISPWGVGAIVPFPNDESVMIAGLDVWRYKEHEEFIVKDDRLVKWLGVNHLRLPPDFRGENSDSINYNLTIPAVRFPNWYYCPHCGTMEKTTYYQGQIPRCRKYQWEIGNKCDRNKKYARLLIPERFVVVCSHGHIDDFPIAEWVHSKSETPYNKDTCIIRRNTGGVSASLAGVSYYCSCGAKRTLSGAMEEGALAKIGYTCSGSMPWLGKYGKSGDCGAEDIRVVLRGATNVWFPDIRSSIFVPKDSASIARKIKSILDNHEDEVFSSLDNGKLSPRIIEFVAKMEKVNFEELYEAFNNRYMGMIENDNKETNYNEDDYRLEEYEVLKKSSGGDVLEFHSINYSIEEYDERVQNHFASFSLVPKLKETRAFVGFSRLNPPHSDVFEQKKMLRQPNSEDNWLPAIEVYGEGVFFEFCSEKLEIWNRMREVQERVKKLDRALSNSLFKLEGPLNPSYILIHTFAHLVTNQLTYECGYGSASIRERIYCKKVKSGSDREEMNGVLLYTASGDSEGSLGGLVRQGYSGRLENTIMAAIENARWCSSDPICISSDGQGPDSCNLAACFNCALLSETSCEVGNRLLDRALIIGSLENPELGFFNS